MKMVLSILADDLNAIVVPVNTDLGQNPHAFVILKDKSMQPEKAISEIMSYCAQNIGEVYRPDTITIVQSYPHTKVGKIDYRLLEKMAQDYVSTANAVKKTGD